MTAKTYSLLTNPLSGSTDTGLDQLIAFALADPSLLGNNDAAKLLRGAEAADSLNKLIMEAAGVIGANSDGQFSSDDVIAMNAYIRQKHLSDWTALHGNDQGDLESGFHLLQNDGAIRQYRGDNLVDTVADGIYHLGFEIKDGYFLNEDGDPNASVQQVADWLTQFYTDRSNTHTGLDRITDMITADAGLAEKTVEADIAAGADAANSLNKMLIDALARTGVFKDGWLSDADVMAINSYLRADPARLAEWTSLHGDDETSYETGYHLVQNDGASTPFSGKNLVNTVADGIYHMAFEVKKGRFLNEDGNLNVSVSDVASWLNYFLSDQSTTGTGLDRITDALKTDPGLSRWTTATDINAGADYANQLNQTIVKAISATNAMADQWITVEDLQAMNAWIRSDAKRLGNWMNWHGNDEQGVETGYHLVQNDGSTGTIFGRNLINTVADGIYHMGFQIKDGRFLNEDGNLNVSLSDVANWLNYFYRDAPLILGSNDGETLQGSTAAEDLAGNDGNDTLEGGGGDDLISGGWGDDTINAGDGNDLLYGNGGRDTLNGGQGSDSYRVTGNLAAGWSSFGGYDIFNDTGTAGGDRIVAIGDGDVDIGLIKFDADTGIETIDATGAKGSVRLLGDWSDDILDFRATAFVGSNFAIDGAGGNDILIGNTANNVIVGGCGNDTMDGVQGSDIYRVTGNYAGGWSSFSGFDTYSDTGANGNDKIVAMGAGDVDIGLAKFDAACGIETIDATGTKGVVRLFGDWNDNILDFRKTAILGKNVVIDGGSGQDTIYGTSANDVIVGGCSGDTMNGGQGGDIYRVTGNYASGWSGFSGFDNYNDTGAGGVDKIVALGEGDVDIGLVKFDASCGIERIDASGAAGTVRLLASGSDDMLDFRKAGFVGNNIVIDGGGGKDTIFGSAAGDVIVGGSGDDMLNGGKGSDIYRVTGNYAGGWSSFSGFDSYNDTGASGIDKIAALGDGDVDIGLKSFNAGSGIEVIDASGTTGVVRLLGGWTDDVLDFRGATLLGGNIGIDGGDGQDTLVGTRNGDDIYGGKGKDILVGNVGADRLDGGAGNDLIVDAQAVNTGSDLLLGGDGKDRIVVGHHDRSTVEVIGGSSESPQDNASDCFTLMNSAKGLALNLVVHGFEAGLDKLDFSQLRDANGQTLSMDDLLVSYDSGNADIAFASGVKTLAGGSVDVRIELLGISGPLTDFAFTDSQVGSGFLNPILAGAYLG